MLLTPGEFLFPFSKDWFSIRVGDRRCGILGYSERNGTIVLMQTSEYARHLFWASSTHLHGCTPTVPRRQEVLAIVDDPKRKAGRNGWIVQRYIERPLLIRGRKFDIRLFVLLVADPSTRSWRRRSKSTNSCQRQNNASDSTPLAKLGHDKNDDAPEEDRERLAGKAGSVDPCPLTAWCHRDAYVRMSSVKYSNDPKKAKDRVRPVICEAPV